MKTPNSTRRADCSTIKKEQSATAGFSKIDQKKKGKMRLFQKKSGLCAAAATAFLFAVLSAAAQTSGGRTPPAPRERPCGLSETSLTDARTFSISRGAETLNFRVFKVRRPEMWSQRPAGQPLDFGISYDDQIDQIRRTLERLPTAHLRELQPIKFVIGRPCSGGGSLPCFDASRHLDERSALCLSLETFRPVTDRTSDFSCKSCPLPAGAPPDERRPRACPGTVKEWVSKRGNTGGWRPEDGFNATIMHEVGHFMDHRYRILSALTAAAQTDCRDCARSPRCYGDGATVLPGETIAEAYMYYFMRKTWWQALGCASAEDCSAGRSPREESNLPNADGSGLFTTVRRGYLVNSAAWENWD